MYHLALVNWDDVTIIDWALGARNSVEHLRYW